MFCKVIFCTPQKALEIRAESMAKEPLSGSRIRSFRIDRGIRQAELARACDISASYLNLIEHNRRRIGGALLNRLARALQVDPVSLSEGAESALTSAVESAAARHPAAGAETDRIEEFAGRFPGLARLIEAQQREVQRQERVIQGLNDRLTHDPFLSASLHDVLSSVTAIRSASAILADGGEIAPEWQARFHRNILEDSRRLAQSTERLVSYLDSGADVERGMSLPQEELDAWLEGREWSVAELETEPGAEIEDVIAEGDLLASTAARDVARHYLRQYARDVAAVPRDDLIRAMDAEGADPAALAARFGVPLPTVFRRLAALPDDAFPDGQARGLVACDGSGTLIFRKPVDGFELPRYGAGCPLWPLFEALQRPTQPRRRIVSVAGRDEAFFTAWATSELRHPGGFDGPSVIEAWMLIAPLQGGPDAETAIAVGVSCRICTQPRCPARREPSLVGAPDADASQVAENPAIRSASF